MALQRFLTHTIKPINESGSLRQTEQEAIKAAINESRGNILETSMHLGISRATLYRKMEKYQIVISKKVHFRDISLIMKQSYHFFKSFIPFSRYL